MAGTSGGPAEEPAIRTEGPVQPGDVEYAEAKVRAALTHTAQPVLFVKIGLAVSSRAAHARRASVDVLVDLDGQLVRVRATAPTATAAVDEAHDRLQERLRRTARHWEAIRGRHW